MDAIDDTSARLVNPVSSHEERQPSLLILLLDLTLTGWEKLEPSFTINNAVSQLLIFINAHLAMHNLNEVAVISYGDLGVHYHYNRDIANTESENVMGGAMYRKFEQTDSKIALSIMSLLQDSDSGGAVAIGKREKCSVSGALSVALCYASRIQRINSSVASRILTLSVSGDDPKSHIATMNCVFAAQKMHIPIDVCSLYGTSTFLQQAAVLTSGVYVDFDRELALLQYLLSAFAVDPKLRPNVNQASQYAVDFTAVCYDTQEKLQIGLVCSVCLIVLKKSPESGRCPVCSTSFSPQTEPPAATPAA